MGLFNRKKKVTPIKAVEPEMALTALPDMDAFRTSLLMPNLEHRFSILRTDRDMDGESGEEACQCTHTSPPSEPKQADSAQAAAPEIVPILQEEAAFVAFAPTSSMKASAQSSYEPESSASEHSQASLDRRDSLGRNSTTDTIDTDYSGDLVTVSSIAAISEIKQKFEGNLLGPATAVPDALSLSQLRAHLRAPSAADSLKLMTVKKQPSTLKLDTSAVSQEPFLPHNFSLSDPSWSPSLGRSHRFSFDAPLSPIVTTPTISQSNNGFDDGAMLALPPKNPVRPTVSRSGSNQTISRSQLASESLQTVPKETESAGSVHEEIMDSLGNRLLSDDDVFELCSSPSMITLEDSAIFENDDTFTISEFPIRCNQSDVSRSPFTPGLQDLTSQQCRTPTMLPRRSRSASCAKQLVLNPNTAITSPRITKPRSLSQSRVLRAFPPPRHLNQNEVTIRGAHKIPFDLARLPNLILSHAQRGLEREPKQKINKKDIGEPVLITASSDIKAVPIEKFSRAEKQLHGLNVPAKSHPWKSNPINRAGDKENQRSDREHQGSPLPSPVRFAPSPGSTRSPSPFKSRNPGSPLRVFGLLLPQDLNQEPNINYLHLRSQYPNPKFMF